MDQTHEAVMMAPPRLMSGAGDHSAKDWEKQRERFTQLYVTEDKTLRESMEIMERLYGFNATWVHLSHDTWQHPNPTTVNVNSNAESPSGTWTRTSKILT
jgi:hypothetical protein